MCFFWYTVYQQDGHFTAPNWRWGSCVSGFSQEHLSVNVLLFSVTLTRQAFDLPMWLLSALHVLYLGSMHITFSVLILLGPLSKDSIQMSGTKGTEVTTPVFGHSMAQGSAALQNRPQGLMRTKVLLSRSYLCWKWTDAATEQIHPKVKPAC